MNSDHGWVKCVGQGRLRWFGHVERKDKSDWVSVSQRMTVEKERKVAEEKYGQKNGRCAREWWVEKWHSGTPSNPCNGVNTDADITMMVMGLVGELRRGELEAEQLANAAFTL
jgi:hypothetical protein